MSNFETNFRYSKKTVISNSEIQKEDYLKVIPE